MKEREERRKKKIGWKGGRKGERYLRKLEN